MAVTTYRLRLFGWDVLTLAVETPPATDGSMDWISSHGGQFEIGFCAPYDQVPAFEASSSANTLT